MLFLVDALHYGLMLAETSTAMCTVLVSRGYKHFGHTFVASVLHNDHALDM